MVVCVVTWWSSLRGLAVFQGFSGASCENDARACGSLQCRNGGTCLSGQKSAPQCLCTGAFTGPECQFPTDSPCTSGPCYNGGTCEYTSEAPYYNCVCPTSFNGLRCHILDYGFQGGFGHDIPPPPAEVDVSCEIPEVRNRRPPPPGVSLEQDWT